MNAIERRNPTIAAALGYDKDARIDKVAAAVEAAVTPADPQAEANDSCEREATAESAVAVIRRQRGLEHPTLKSAWTTREIARLLHELHADPMGEIRLGAQHLGAGFTKAVDIEQPVAPTISKRQPTEDPDDKARARVDEAEAAETRALAETLAPERAIAAE